MEQITQRWKVHLLEDDPEQKQIGYTGKHASSDTINFPLQTPDQSLYR